MAGLGLVWSNFLVSMLLSPTSYPSSLSHFCLTWLSCQFPLIDDKEFRAGMGEGAVRVDVIGYLIAHAGR